MLERSPMVRIAVLLAFGVAVGINLGQYGSIESKAHPVYRALEREESVKLHDLIQRQTPTPRGAFELYIRLGSAHPGSTVMHPGVPVLSEDRLRGLGRAEVQLEEYDPNVAADVADRLMQVGELRGMFTGDRQFAIVADASPGRALEFVVFRSDAVVLLVERTLAASEGLLG